VGVYFSRVRITSAAALPAMENLERDIAESPLRPFLAIGVAREKKIHEAWREWRRLGV
jgi:hypothetical protein